MQALERRRQSGGRSSDELLEEAYLRLFPILRANRMTLSGGDIDIVVNAGKLQFEALFPQEASRPLPALEGYLRARDDAFHADHPYGAVECGPSLWSLIVLNEEACLGNDLLNCSAAKVDVHAGSLCRTLRPALVRCITPKPRRSSPAPPLPGAAAPITMTPPGPACPAQRRPLCAPTDSAHVQVANDSRPLDERRRVDGGGAAIAWALVPPPLVPLERPPQSLWQEQEFGCAGAG